MLSYIKKHHILSELKLVVIVDSPLKIIFPTIASTIIGIYVKPFSTLKAAITWAENN